MPYEELQELDYTVAVNHGLPMRMMLGELRALRTDEEYFKALAESLAHEERGELTWPHASFGSSTSVALNLRLQQKLSEMEEAYRRLDAQKEKISTTVRLDVTTQSGLADLERSCSEADKPLKRMLHALRGNAVTFSGGGIRSASFSLGVLQGLARFSLGDPGENLRAGAPEENQLLRDTQYISTVSGGGYLGCWFSSWIARLAQDVSEQEQPTPPAFRKAYGIALDGLAGRLPQTSADPSPETVRHLRQFTSYLAPQLGFSLDVWDLFAIVIRNLLINWLMLGPVLLCFATLATLLVFWLDDAHQIVGNQPFFYLLLTLLVGGSAIRSGCALPSYRPWIGASLPPRARTASTGFVFRRFVIPILIVCFLLAAHFYPCAMPAVGGRMDAAWLAAVSTAGFSILGVFKWWTHYARYPGEKIVEKPPAKPLTAGIWIFVVAVILGTGTGLALEFVGTRALPLVANFHPLHRYLRFEIDWENYFVFSVPAFMSILLVGSTLFSALTEQMETEEDREWWSRAGGALMMCSLVWLASTALAIYGTAVPQSTYLASVPSISGGLLGLLTSFLAKSSKTGAGTRPDKSQASPGRLTHLILPALALLSLALMAIALMRASTLLRNHWQNDFFRQHPADAALVSLVVFAFLGTAVNRVVSVNLFSLHGLYRERLTRAFLGASNLKRHSDAFTDFDSADSLLMKQLAKLPGVPLHIVNTTLNLVGTRRAEWRQRRAESFTFSAVSSGAWRLNYVGADKFGGDQGVSVATAMAISGAAANPNMGYHSSPLVTILMALFNVRLGWWLPNPKYPLDHQYDTPKRNDFWRRSSPKFSVWPLLQELFGLTDDTSGYVELTDGGHFENLGLYEMVMRRCKNIIVVDAGADRTYSYEDLGNALRKIEIDLGIPIEFAKKPTMQAGHKAMANLENRYCAVGTIRYSCVDSNAFPDVDCSDLAGKLDGTLVYIKACLNGVSEPMGVAEYSNSHPMFPHEPTSDQFFNEAQFESYRSLGSHAVECIGRKNGTGWGDWITAAKTHAGLEAAEETC